MEHYSDADCIYVKIAFPGGRYSLTETGADASLELCIWNQDGSYMGYCLKPLVNGNSAAVKLLAGYKWYRNTDGNFTRFGKEKLMPLGDNYAENISLLFAETLRLLKNGLGIYPARKNELV
jgi:hypothetical protein